MFGKINTGHTDQGRLKSHPKMFVHSHMNSYLPLDSPIAQKFIHHSIGETPHRPESPLWVGKVPQADHQATAVHALSTDLPTFRYFIYAVVPERLAWPFNKLRQVTVPGRSTRRVENDHRPLPGGVAVMAEVVAPLSPGYVTVMPILLSTR